MTDWRISIPYQHRDEPLSATAGFARHAPTDDDRATARQIVIAAMTRGVRTAGGLLDELEALEPHERRAMLDEARGEAGLEPVGEIEWREQYEALQRTSRRQPTEIRRRPDGTFYEVAPPARFSVGASGQLVDHDQADADTAREHAAAQSRAAARRAAQPERDRDAADARASAEARAARVRSELPPGVPG